MKKIVLFNHKGGVSKTTTVFHIGWMLAKLGKKVLLIDADPQCNLTSIFLGDKFDSYYDEDSTKNENIKDALAKAFNGTTEPLKAVTCPSTERNENLFLLPGHMSLSEYDAQLTFSQTASNAFSSLKSLPGSFNDLIVKTAKQYDIDYVFIDLNPGLSSINQNLFMISDAFIIPTNPDTFSLMALKSLSLILPKWVKWKNENIELFRDSAYPLPESTTKFLGEIAQRFNIRNGVPTKPFKDKIDELKNITIDILIPKLRAANMLLTEEQYSKAGLLEKNYVISEIKDFQGLSPKSHNANVPVYELTDEELGSSGAALQGMKENRDGFGELYKDIAGKILRLLSDENTTR